MITVKVPATSANMGAGFDTLGVALNLYNTMEISQIPSGLEISSSNMEVYLPRNEHNLVYRAIKEVFHHVGYKMCGLRIRQKSEIPVTRGLGSSSACIIGGMLAANIISGRKLSYEEILDLAVGIEGHPDNLAPALYGGFCASMMKDHHVICESMKLNPNIRFAVMIPDYFVPTKKSRKVLPAKISHEQAAFNISRATMFALALSQGKLDDLKIAVEDQLHQPYRETYVENMYGIFEKTYELGAKATYLSGSGPTIVSILDEDVNFFGRNMQQFFNQNEHSWRCRILSIDNVGAVVKTI